MKILFRDNYVNYNQISDISLMEINDVLIEDNIFLELGDGFNNDWAGYSYYYCKSLGELDDKAISSFVYIINWFMTGNPIEVNPHFKSNVFYKNNLIINECLEIYNNILDDYDSEIELCSVLFKEIYKFYLGNYMKYAKKTERINCVLTYHEFELFDKIPSNNRSDKMRILLNSYYGIKD